MQTVVDTQRVASDIFDWTGEMIESGIDDRFTELVARTFSKLDFSVKRRVSVAANERPHMLTIDILLEWQDVKSVVEVKTYRTLSPNLVDIVRSAEFLAHARESLPADHALLVTSLRRARLPDTSVIPADVMIVTLDDLMHMAGGDADLIDAFSSFERELNSALGEFDKGAEPTPSASPPDIGSLQVHSTAPAGPIPPMTGKGADLCAELSEIIPGKVQHQTLTSGRKGTNWRLLEQVGLESLTYVFEGILGGWLEQKAIGGQANRFDAMAKIIGDDVFCRTLVEDFRTRHILFEFKNHAKRLKPNVVHVTEKYLFPTALRSTAIVISPEGFGDETSDAARGALRDAAKLMLDLTVPQLCKMLKDKDRGVPPSLAMEAMLDGFLRSLGR